MCVFLPQLPDIKNEADNSINYCASSCLSIERMCVEKPHSLINISSSRVSSVIGISTCFPIASRSLIKYVAQMVVVNVCAFGYLSLCIQMCM